jgi:hypothetical protein
LLAIYAAHHDRKGRCRTEVTSPPSRGNSHKYRFGRPRRCRPVV